MTKTRTALGCRTRTRWCTAGTAIVAMMLMSGCGNDSGGGDLGASHRATHFYAALAADDGTAACADLAAEAREALAEQESQPCAKAIVQQGLKPPSEKGAARAYGSMAQVRYAGETVFLSRFPDGWRVTAAGCPPVAGDQPHRCTIEVG